MSTTGRSYGGMSAAQRAAARRQRLVDAATTLIAEHGTSALTVHRVCRQAGLNERYYYESFPGHDDLLVAVAEDAGARLVAALVAAMATAGPEPSAQATATIGAGVDLLVADPRMTRLLEESAGHPVLARLRADLTRTLVALIQERGMTSLGIEPTPEVERDAAFAATLLLGGLVEVLTAWTAGTLALTRDEVVARCVETFLLIGDHAVRER